MIPAPADTALMVKINHRHPIEISDFVATMNAVGSLFDGFCKKNGDSKEARKAKLYVQKIEHGSIEILLTEAITSLALPLCENMNLVFEFAGHIKSVIEYFTQGVGVKPDLDDRELRSYKDIFAVTAGDHYGTTEIGAIQIGTHGGTVFNNCTFNYNQSNSAQNQIQREETHRKNHTPASEVYERLLMTIFQMRGATTADTGNKAVIEELSPRPLAVVFESDELKRRILHDFENPTKNGYLVDVTILSANGRAAAYKVMQLHDVIRLDD